MDPNYFDVIVLGTALTESIVAAALSKAGFKLAHIDVNRFYGGDEASLSLDELVEWINAKATAQSPRSKFTHLTHQAHAGTLSHSRYYSISLCPSIIPSVGPTISSLILSGVSKYGGFRLVDSVAIYDAASRTVKNVPSTKEDVFRNKEINLVNKRRIMRFLSFAMSEFEAKQELEGKHDMAFSDFMKSVFALDDGVSTAVSYSLSYCISPTERTLPALTRLRRYLRSVGRYGPSPFLVGHYGGAGEIAQGFCRAAAVHGAIYILGRRVLSITALDPENSHDDYLYAITLEDVSDPLFCKMLISSPSMAEYLPPNPRQLSSSDLYKDTTSLSIVRGIAIVDGPITFPSASPVSDESQHLVEERKTVDTGVIVFPPSLPDGSTSNAATVFFTGEGSMSAPKGKSILYLAVPVESDNGVSPEKLLKPYVETMLSLAIDHPAPKPLFTASYIEHVPASPLPQNTTDQKACLVTPPLRSDRLPEVSDMAATHAEEVFWEAVRVLRQGPSDAEGMVGSFWPPETAQEDDDEEL